MSGIASAAGIKTQLTPDGQSHVAVSLQASAQARLRGPRCSITPQSRTEGPVISPATFVTIRHIFTDVCGTSLRVNRCDRSDRISLNIRILKTDQIPPVVNADVDVRGGCWWIYLPSELGGVSVSTQAAGSGASHWQLGPGWRVRVPGLLLRLRRAVSVRFPTES